MERSADNSIMQTNNDMLYYTHTHIVQVVHMEPVLHGVRGLLSDLNGGGELKTFCKQIRQKFKDTLKETIN